MSAWGRTTAVGLLGVALAAGACGSEPVQPPGGGAATANQNPDGTIPEPPKVAVQRGHGQTVFAVAVSEDGTLVATADLNGARPWTAASGQELRSFDSKSEIVALAANSRRLITGGEVRRFVGHDRAPAVVLWRDGDP